MLVRLFNLSKRVNSTKRPSGDGTEVDAQLKMDCSAESPILLINNVKWDINFNYMYIPSWNSYYFLENATIQTGMVWETRWSMDALATYKNDIGNYTAFVERASSRFDPYVNDAAISQEQFIKQIDDEASSIPNWSSTGTYILRTVGTDGIANYMISASQLKEALNFMFTDSADLYDFITDTITKAFFNPFQYIVGCKWFPFDFSSVLSGTDTTVKYGWWTNTGVPHATLLNDASLKYSFILEPTMPTPTYTDFRKYNSSWSKYTIYLPAIGSFPLDAIYADGVKARYNIDIVTGDCTILLFSANNDLITTQRGTIGIDVQLGQIATDGASIASGAIGTAGAAMSGNIFGEVAGITSIASNVVQPTPSVFGGLGNKAALTSYPAVTVTLLEYETCDIPETVAGRPLCKNVKLNTLSGYIKCGNASVPIASIRSEKETVDNFLNSGFYME